MAGVAKKTNEDLWDRVKTKVTKADKGGKAGQWSARKAQLATQEYKAKGGGYEGAKSKDNHLGQWTKEEWNTRWRSDVCGNCLMDVSGLAMFVRVRPRGQSSLARLSFRPSSASRSPCAW